jgi:Fe-S-cluster-containing dehydrogenase component
MTVTRRFLLKAGSAVTALAAAATPLKPAQARGNAEVSPDALGLLFDSTLCIGCKACVAACKEANNMPAEFSTAEQHWDTPLDISGKTLNVIKLWAEGTAETKDRADNGFAFVKKSCLHCIDPSCVSACPVSAMTKDRTTGIVGYDPNICIGCRYCVAACPFGVPRFQYDTATPRIQKCQLCKHRLAEGKIPACAEVCPTGATFFGKRADLMTEAKRRLTLDAGKPAVYPRSAGADHEKPAPKYLQHIYGEKEVGGTQMLMLSGVPFDKLGYPDLPERSYSSRSETLQHSLYGFMALPIAAFAGLTYFARKSIGHAADELED